ncbi:MAG: HAD family phosphatase [Colwellia sp.]
MDNNTVFVFDFDGVIVNSISALHGVYMEFLSQFGIRGNQEEFNLLNGPKLSEIVSFFKKKYNLNETNIELLNIYTGKISSIYENIKLNNGIEEILKLLRNKNFAIALASSSKRIEIDNILNKNKLNSYFDFIITGDDVTKSKPSPEMYEILKKKFINHNYYVVEDSNNGIAAAMNAGMKTILYNPTQKESSVEPTYEINSLKKIEKIITEIDLNCFTVAKSKAISLKLISHKPTISTQQTEAIEKLWNNELKKGQLFNGDIVSYKSHYKSNNTLTIECFTTQYKYFFAQLRNPDLNLKIHPIGVSGIVIDKENNTLLAIRHNVTEYNGFYELLPAGSIDSSKIKNDDIPFQEQLITEFEEETKISKDNIRKIEPYCFTLDKNHEVYDICSKIHINGLINELLDPEENEEYVNIREINLSNLYNIIEANSVVPTSVVIFNNLD